MICGVWVIFIQYIRKHINTTLLLQVEHDDGLMVLGELASLAPIVCSFVAPLSPSLCRHPIGALGVIFAGPTAHMPNSTRRPVRRHRSSLYLISCRSPTTQAITSKRRTDSALEPLDPG